MRRSPQGTSLALCGPLRNRWHSANHGRVGETYNIGGSNNWSNLEIVNLLGRTLAEITGEPTEKYTRLITFVADRPGHDWRYAIDSSKIHKELDWSPAETFESGMRKTLEWYLSQHSASRSATLGDPITGAIWRL